MPTRQEHVRAAQDLCAGAAESIRALDGVGEEWRSDALATLEAVQGTLEEVQGRFLLRSKLCLPFAARCEHEARRLNEALAALGVRQDDDARRQTLDALAALELAAATLDERSGAQGTTIT